MKQATHLRAIGTLSAVIVTTAALAGCGGSSSSAPTTVPSTTVAPTTTAAATTTAVTTTTLAPTTTVEATTTTEPPVTTPDEALNDPVGKLLLSDVPDGFVRQVDSAGDTGPSDLEKAANDTDLPNAKKLLVRDGFVHGYQRLWATAAGDSQIIVAIYQFKTAKGAADYCKIELDHSTTSTPDVVRMPLPAIPGAALLAATDGATNAVIVTWATDVWCSYIDVVEPVTADSVAHGKLAAQLALAQDENLKKSGGAM